TRKDTPSERAISCMAGISPQFWVVSTVLMLVGMRVAARSLTASIALSYTPRPRIASQVSLVAPSILTWMAIMLLFARRATRASSSRVPLVEIQVMIPRAWQAARISSKSGRMNGSPPPKFTWNTLASCSCSTRSSASSRESSPMAGSPEEERQWLQRRLQARETSQVRFTGDRSPISTNRLLMEISFFAQFLQEAEDFAPLTALQSTEVAAYRFLPGEEVRCDQSTGFHEEESRPP